MRRGGGSPDVGVEIEVQHRKKRLVLERVGSHRNQRLQDGVSHGVAQFFDERLVQADRFQ